MKQLLTMAAAGVATVLVSTSAQAGFSYATGVENFDQGMQKDGNTIPFWRSESTFALGAEQNDDTLNYVSLGFGGSLTLSFADSFSQSVSIWETTYGTEAAHPERAEIFIGAGASWDTAVYFSIGMVENTADGAPIDITTVVANSGFNAFNFVRIVDMSDPDAVTQLTADGFDVDAVAVDAPPVPAPAALALLGVAGVTSGRRRRG